ncbi:MAG: nitrilase-related carbon-nitrogen hydrolase [Saprospiraceae bacterium]
MDNFSISLIQIPTIWESAEQNRNQVSSLIHNELQHHQDLILLPEMWTTGFSMRPEVLAEDMDGLSIQWMKAIAKEKDCAIVGSLIIAENSKFYNRLIFAKPDGNLEYYDKRHCFGLAKEDQYFTPGKEKLIVEWRGWRICPQICYDLRFPVWSRNVEEYDLLLYVAQFPEKRRNAWLSLLAARAIENVSYVAAVNGVGKDGNGIVYTGDSGIWDYEGKNSVNLESKHCSATSLLNKTKQDGFRRAYPFLRDQDRFDFL